jgi:hypothetical protein
MLSAALSVWLALQLGRGQRVIANRPALRQIRVSPNELRRRGAVKCDKLHRSELRGQRSPQRST